VPFELGRHHPRIAGLHALLTPKGRREQGRFIFEGATLLEEALAAGLVPSDVIATQAAYDRHRIAARWEERGVPVAIVSERTFAHLSDVTTPSGLLAAAPIRLATLEVLLAPGEPVLVLAGIADPGNAGTLVRSAEAFGVRRIVFGDGGIDPHHPKVVRAAMGSLFRAELATADGAELVAAARAAGRPIVAADRDGTSAYGFDFPAGCLLVIGAERGGIHGWLPGWDALVGIPHAGGAESLNAGVAGSLLLYEMQRPDERPKNGEKP